MASLFLLFALLIFPAASTASVDADALLKQASNALTVGKIDQACTLFKQVPAPGPNGDDGQYVYSRMQLARISYSMKDPAKARSYAEQVISVYPDNVEAQNFLTSLDRETKPQWQKTLEDCKRFMPNLLKGVP